MSATDGALVDLSDLGDVDWPSLQHAYGSAEDVPALISSLASPDPETRKQAIYDAFGNIWHQGTIYGATVEAVPFLIRIAVAPGIPDRGQVIELLAAIAAGTGYAPPGRQGAVRPLPSGLSGDRYRGEDARPASMDRPGTRSARPGHRVARPGVRL